MPRDAESDDHPSLVLRAMRGLSNTARGCAAEMLDAIWPGECIACQNRIDAQCAPVVRPGLCAACADLVAPLLASGYCPRCARTARPESIHERGCAWCRTERVWNIAGIARLGPYESPLRELLCDLKFRGSQRAANWISDRLAVELRRQSWFDRIETLVPVPMHWLRRLQRPCAHARVLAEALGARLGLPVRSWVWRRRYAPSQMQIASRHARMENVADCFGPPLWKLGRIRGRRICIVDNLVVSAATIHEVSKVLRSLGAAEIYVATACRAVGPAGFQAKPGTAQRVTELQQGASGAFLDG
ncbi:MAG: ComF family protein [Phycisphaerales bacterium]|nr:ComF family protein [Phycisphaerales bacterium]